MSKRAAIFYLATFVISWGAWAPLVFHDYAEGPRPALTLALIALGGLGPTIAAYIAVIATRRTAPLAEFHARLLRWRLAPAWYAAAFVVPVLLVMGSMLLAPVVDPHALAGTLLRPWYFWFALLPLMVLGGGLEELGWRGVALPECQTNPVAAALVVGLIWAVWHMPLFAMPGTSQFDLNYAVFAIQSVGLGLILAWFYWRTGSILPCILFHASFNAAMGLGFSGGSFSLLLAAASLLLGAVLMIGFRPRPSCDNLAP